MEKKVLVRKDICVGCGLCISMSDVFVFGDDGLAEAITEVVDSEKVEEVENAAKSCPVSAIEVE